MSVTMKQAERLAIQFLATDSPVFLWGAPGVGKSDLVRSISKSPSACKRIWNLAKSKFTNGVKLIDLRAVLLDPVDLRGLPTIGEDFAKWLPPQFLPNEKRDGKYGILFLDELNAAPASVQAACFQLILDRKLGEYTLPQGWRIIAAGNRQGDRAAAQRMPSALANRFAHIEIEPDVESFIDWCTDNRINPIVPAFVKFRPEKLHDMQGGESRAFPTPRSHAVVAKNLDDINLDTDDDILFPLISGIVGEGCAAEYVGFINIYKTMPSMEAIIMSPESADIPPADKPAIAWALAMQLAHYADSDNFESIVNYCGRLQKEFEIMAVKNAVERDRALCNTQTYSDWIVNNKSVMI